MIKASGLAEANAILSDGFHPRQDVSLCIHALALLFQVVEQAGFWPRQIRYIVAFLLSESAYTSKVFAWGQSKLCSSAMRSLVVRAETHRPRYRVAIVLWGLKEHCEHIGRATFLE